MIKIIDGKKFNTQTAMLVAEWDNGYCSWEMMFQAGSLYRTKRGNWFVVFSCFERVFGSSARGRDIRPLTSEEAMAWLEEKNFTAELEEYFADITEEA